MTVTSQLAGGTTGHQAPSGYFSMTKTTRSEAASVRDAMLASPEKSQNLM